jgi:trans-aconitate 2-methyltransferase
LSGFRSTSGDCAIGLERHVSDPWNPEQYGKFLSEREQPFADLVALVEPCPTMHVVDLGCGTGRLTRRLHAQLRAASTLGLDRSVRMLASARDEGEANGLRFEQRDITDFPVNGEHFDLIFSNAALHWVDDHAALFERLTAALTANGQLAVQMPAMHDNLSHLLAAELAAEEPFRSACAGWSRSQPVLSPESYAELLFRAGFRHPIVRLIVYPHVLNGPEDVVEWMKGTLLAEYSRHLPSDVFEVFLRQYRRRLLDRIGFERPFFFPFKRILLWGRKSG